MNEIRISEELRIAAVRANARHFARIVRDSYYPIQLPGEINKNIDEDLFDVFVDFCYEFEIRMTREYTWVTT
jgi:hypothetical protein